MRFEDFTAARLPAVLRFAGVLTGDRALAEDVVQEVLLRAHRRWRQIGDLDHPESYVRNEGLTDGEIEDVLGCAPGTVRGMVTGAYVILSEGWTNDTPSAAGSAQGIPGQ